MNSGCKALADTGMNIWLLAGIAASVIVFGLVLLTLVARKRGVHYKLGRGTAIFVALLVLGHLVITTGVVKAAPATNCVPPATSGTSSNNTAPVTNPAALELVDDSYDNTNGVHYDPGGSWFGTLDILANDNPPSGDPIDPATVKLVGSWPATSYPQGNSYWILDPSDPSNPTDPDNPTDPSAPYGQFTLANVDGDFNSTDGLINFYLNTNTPFNSTFTIQYTARTMSGVLAAHNATITIKNDGYVTLPPPTLVDNSFTLGTNYGNSFNSTAMLPILPNDLPQPGDPLNTDTLRLIDPDDSNQTGTGYTTYADLGDLANSWITWEVFGDFIGVKFGPAVPNDTPFSIDYTVSSQAGVPPVGPATITVTRSSTADVEVNTVNEFFGTDCNDAGVGDTVDLVAHATTNTGTIDPLSIDLDPSTPGRQTTFTNHWGTITVDNDGIATLTNGTTNYGAFTYTISNTNGDISNISGIFIIDNHSCG